MKDTAGPVTGTAIIFFSSGKNASCLAQASESAHAYVLRCLAPASRLSKNEHRREQLALHDAVPLCARARNAPDRTNREPGRHTSPPPSLNLPLSPSPSFPLFLSSSSLSPVSRFLTRLVAPASPLTLARVSSTGSCVHVSLRPCLSARPKGLSLHPILETIFSVTSSRASSFNSCSLCPWHCPSRSNATLSKGRMGPYRPHRPTSSTFLCRQEIRLVDWWSQYLTDHTPYFASR